MGAVRKVLRFVGLMPGRSMGDVWAEAEESDRRREESKETLRKEARIYLMEHGDGMSTEALAEILGHDEVGEEEDADQQA